MSSAKKKQTTIARLPDGGGGVIEVTASEKQKDAALLALLKKGGRSARPDIPEEEKIPEVRLSLRVPEDVAERIKQAAKTRPINTPRHSWIIEAILEKLKKESF